MEKLSLSLFNDASLAKSKLKRVIGGAASTEGGSKTVSEGQPSSAKVTWSSDTENANGTITQHNYCRKDDSGVVVAGCEVA